MTLEKIIQEKKDNYPDLRLIEIDKDKMIEQVNKTKRKSHLDIVSYSYCCYGVETNCWIDTISCWYTSLEELKKSIISSIKNIEGDLYYAKIDGSHFYLTINFKDMGPIPENYKFDEYREEEFKSMCEDPRNKVPSWSNDIFTKEDYYNRFIRYDRFEQFIIIKDID